MVPQNNGSSAALSPWRRRIHDIIFEADTFEGKLFDVVLLVSIALSVGVVMLESVDSINQRHSRLLQGFEWGFTILFTIEYILRLMAVQKPLRYARSFFGVVDLLSILPTYVTFFLAADAHYLLTIRILRLLRLFRIFKIARYIGGANVILLALRASRPKIVVFLFAMVTMAIAMGTVMYIVEGPTNPAFSSIPQSTYWAIVTITTVGYGDISPMNPFGKFIASVAMIIGYAIIAVPTGIVGAELNRQMRQSRDYSNRACTHCSAQVHTADAVYCRICGEKLDAE